MNRQVTAVNTSKRGNSTRLPNKNIFTFGDSNLLLHKIHQLQQVEGLSEIICSSDSDEMLKIAEDAGIKAIKKADAVCGRVGSFRNVSGVCMRYCGKRPCYVGVRNLSLCGAVSLQ